MKVLKLMARPPVRPQGKAEQDAPTTADEAEARHGQGPVHEVDHHLDHSRPGREGRCRRLQRGGGVTEAIT